MRSLNLQQHDAETYKKGFEAARQDNKIVTTNVPDGGPSFQYRHHSDEKGNEAAGRVMGAVRKNLGKGELEGAAYWNGLRDVFSVQGRVLKTRQIGALLTGYTGQNETPGAFKRNPDFKGGASDALEALQSEVARVRGKFAPSNDEERGLLHKAVHAVALAKDIPAADVQQLHVGIRGQAAAPAPAAEPAVSGNHEPGGVSIDDPFSPSLPREWDTDKLQQASHGAVQQIAPRLGLAKPIEKEGLSETIQALARMAKSTRHGADLTEHEAATAAMHAIGGVSKGGAVNAEMARDAVVNIEPEAFGEALDREIRNVRSRRKVAKAILLDDFDALAKSFGRSAGDALGNAVDAVASEARVPAGLPGGGEFAAGAGGGGRGAATPGQLVARHTVEAASEAGENAARSALRTKSPVSQAWYHPVRVANEGGAALAGEAAWQAASAFLPEVKWAGLAAEGFGAFAASAGKKALRMGASTIAGQAGAIAGQQAGNLAARGAYRLGGSKAPAYQPPEYHSGKEIGAELAGGIAGTFAGTTAGRTAGAWIGGALGSVVGPGGTAAGALAGTVVGGALGNYLGGQLSRAGFNWFAGHDQAQVARATNRYLKPQSGARSTPATA